jgi:hypothetical protein
MPPPTIGSPLILPHSRWVVVITCLAYIHYAL